MRHLGSRHGRDRADRPTRLLGRARSHAAGLTKSSHAPRAVRDKTGAVGAGAGRYHPVRRCAARCRAARGSTPMTAGGPMTDMRPKLFVLDTNVILHDSGCIRNFDEHDVAVPITVLEELDQFKRGNEDIHFQAREFLRRSTPSPATCSPATAVRSGRASARSAWCSAATPTAACSTTPSCRTRPTIASCRPRSRSSGEAHRGRWCSCRRTRTCG